MLIRSIVILGAGALSVSACGSSGSAAASRPQPSTPVILSAIVTPTQVRLSPSHLRPGPVQLTVTNQSAHSVAVLVSAAGHSSAVARTAPLNPQGVTQLQFDLRRGRYTVAARRSGRRSDAQRSLRSRVATATLRVTGTPASAGSQTLQP